MDEWVYSGALTGYGSAAQIQTLTLPWGGDAPCSGNAQCVTVPSGQCEDSTQASYDSRLCRLGQLTLSQDKCYVGVGGLNLEQNAVVYTKSSDGSSQPSRFIGYKPSTNDSYLGSGYWPSYYAGAMTPLNTRDTATGATPTGAKTQNFNTLPKCDVEARMTVTAKIVPLTSVPSSSDTTNPY